MSVFYKSVPLSSSEPMILNSLRHSNIIELTSIERRCNCFLLEFPFYQQGDLSRLISARLSPLSECEVVRILADMLQALSYIHAKGIIHRDVKQQNILVGNGKYVLTDFGSAKASGEADNLLFKTLTCTPLNCSPEILKEQLYDEMVDIYSLGITIIECMQFKSPFVEQHGDSIVEILERIEHGNLLLNEQFWSYSRKLCNLVLNMVDVNPKKRSCATQILYDLGIEIVGCFRSKLSVTDLIITPERNAKKNVEDVRRKRTDGELLGEFNNSQASLEKQYKNRLAQEEYAEFYQLPICDVSADVIEPVFKLLLLE